MRKTLALFLALIIALISAYSLAFTAVNKEKDNVIISEKYIYGDKTYAENVDVNFKALYSENLLWDIKYDIASGKAETDFSIYKDRIRRDFKSQNELNLYTVLYYNHFGKTEDNSPMNNAFEELAETAAPYEEVKKTVYISDYTDYYPINVDVAFENFYLDSSFHRETTAPEGKLIKALKDFFRIPVIKNHRIRLHVQVDENGNITHSGTSTVTEDGDYELFSFYAESAVSEKECFIYFDNRSNYGPKPDISLIPGGYGIYSLPYSDTGKEVIFDTENLRNVFPVKESESIYQLELSANKEELYMMSQEGNKCYLTVIDAETHTEKSKTLVSDREELSSHFGFIDKDFIVISHSHPYNDPEISLYTPDGKGGFDKQFTTLQYVEDETEIVSDEDSFKYAGGDFYLGGNDFDVKWDGERLYVTNSRGDNSPIIREGNFSLSIYDKKGLQFCGEYKTSLTTGYDGYQASGYYIGISDYDPIEIKLS